MLYSSSDKIKQYLKDYNIVSVTTTRKSTNVKFILKNLHTGIDYKLQCDKPLYNVLSQRDSTAFLLNNSAEIEAANELRNITFSDSTISTLYYNTFYNKPYRQKYKTLEIEKNQKWASEYFTYLEIKDIEKIKKLAGLDTYTTEAVYGNFFKLSDNSLRFLFNPKYPVLENVDEVLMCDFYLYTTNGLTYPIYYIIYTIAGSSDVYLEYNNMMVNSINNKGSITINLSQLFGNRLPTMLNDFKTLEGMNTKLFIVNNLFNIGIYYNTPSGIIRYIPINLDINFFDYVFNNAKIGSPIFYNKGQDTQSKNLVAIINEKKLIPLTDMENISLLNQLLHLSSTAEYFNDVLFSLEDSLFNFPVYLVTEYDDLVNSYSYPNLD